MVSGLEVENKESQWGLREVIIEGCRSWGPMKNMENNLRCGSHTIEVVSVWHVQEIMNQLKKTV